MGQREERTGQLQGLGKVVKDEFGKDGEAVVVLEEQELGLGLFGGGGVLCQSRTSQSAGVEEPHTDSERRTRIFFSATNTLGAETTATVMSAVAPSRSSLASRVAVSSEYCTNQVRQRVSVHL